MLRSTQTTSQTQAKAPTAPSARWNLLASLVRRFLLVLLVGSTLLWLVHRSSERLDRDLRPAGFSRGVLHGALMPLALPNLLFGRDVSIYAVNNTGRLYKLGYTVGVNGSGALFFGLAFWRLTRWRSRNRAPHASGRLPTTR
jgi:hypothetical protein